MPKVSRWKREPFKIPDAVKQPSEAYFKVKPMTDDDLNISFNPLVITSTS
jgi:hypothetical protein